MIKGMHVIVDHGVMDPARQNDQNRMHAYFQ